MRKFISAAACFALCAGLFSGPVSAAGKNDRVIAQSTPQSTGTINGTVRDPQGGLIGSASVSVTGSGQNYTATTGDDGTFTVSVPPGLYAIIVNKGGFQASETDDVAVASGASISVTIGLTAASLGSLRVIGRTSAATQNRFNSSESAIAVLPPQAVSIRQTNNLTDIGNELPGITVQRGFGSTPNTSFVVRGDPIQTRVNIDGHPVSSGISGQYNTNYQESGIFSGIQVLKGAGLNGPTAGESDVGTVNLSTLDFSSRNSASVQFGIDSFSGTFYRANATANTLNGKLQFVAAKDYVGYVGPFDNYLNANRLNTAGAAGLTAAPPATYSVPYIAGIDQWQGDLSNRYSLESELAKVRFNFSSATSFTASFLGLQGQYQPQGGSYATYYGHTTLNACNNPAAAKAPGLQPGLGTCAVNAVYAPPYTFNQIGATVDGYGWFPNSFIQNNEPYFFAELRTTLKNDTLLLRPYTGIINRYISGANENNYPGNGGGFYAVTNAANCQVTFNAPTAAAGAKGPCFGLNMMPTSPAYVGNDATPHTYNTTNVAPSCSPTPPYTCYTTATGQQNNGVIGYGTPFSQPELDQIHGYTFTYIHPVGQNVYNFSYDYNADYAQSASGDQTIPPAGCQLTVGGFGGAGAAKFQPSCPLATQATGAFLPQSSIGTPPTLIQKNDFSLTGQFQLRPQLQLFIGNYYTQYTANAQIENPATLAQYATLGSSNAAPVDLITRVVRYNHYDPHIAFEFRPTSAVSLRASGGSSITVPYASLISGFGSVTLANAANNNTIQFSTPNVNLAPETTVAYDLGGDIRIGRNVFSADLFNNTVHNVFLTSTQVTSTSPLTTTSQQINGPIYRSYGLEFTAQNTPPIGFGYYATATLQRAYNDQLPLSIYSASGGNFNVNGEQIFQIPNTKAYAELRYAAPRNLLLTFGADYEGTNNSTNGKAFVLLNGSGRIDLIPGHTTLGLSIENLANYSVGNALGRALYRQASVEPTLTLLPNGSLAYNTSPSNGLINYQALPYRTFRFSVTQHF